MATITCKLPKELDDKLTAEAAKRQVSKSVIVRLALEAQLSKSQKVTSLFDQMQDGLGCIDTGVPDLATNKSYLGAYGGKKVRHPH
jgi:predicted transcriptional regulator